jgi:hypothetical protein
MTPSTRSERQSSRVRSREAIKGLLKPGAERRIWNREAVLPTCHTLRIAMERSEAEGIKRGVLASGEQVKLEQVEGRVGRARSALGQSMPRELDCRSREDCQSPGESGRFRTMTPRNILSFGLAYFLACSSFLIA